MYTFAIKSLYSEDFKLTAMPVKTRSSLVISSDSPLEWMAPAATKFERTLSDWLELIASWSLHVFDKLSSIATQLLTGIYYRNTKDYNQLNLRILMVDGYLMEHHHSEEIYINTCRIFRFFGVCKNIMKVHLETCWKPSSVQILISNSQVVMLLPFMVTKAPFWKQLSRPPFASMLWQYLIQMPASSFKASLNMQCVRLYHTFIL